MDESLFTTRQLTEYSQWSCNRKGCLFYISEIPIFDIREGIYFIDSPIRENDKCGEYDILHASELNALKEKRAVVNGSLGYLFYHCAIASKTKWSEYISLYYLSPDILTLSAPERLDILLRLCQEWIFSDKTLLCSYPDTNLVNFLKDAFRSSVLTILSSFEKSTKDMMWGMIVNSPINERIGFTSYFLNYIAARSICKHLPQWCTNNDDLAQSILDYLSVNGVVFPMDKMDFQLTLLEHKKACSAYLIPIKEEMLDKFAPELKAIFQPTKSAFWPCYRLIIKSELDKYETDKKLLEKVLPTQIEYVQIYVCAFLHHMVRSFEFLEDETAMHSSYINSKFPDNIVKMIPAPMTIYEHPEKSVLNLILPEVGNYNALVRYVSERRKIDPDFARQLDNKSTYKAKCTFLKSIVGWLPNDNSLEHNLKARLKKRQDTGGLTFFPTR